MELTKEQCEIIAYALENSRSKLHLLRGFSDKRIDNLIDKVTIWIFKGEEDE